LIRSLRRSLLFALAASAKHQKQERNNNNRHYDYLFASRARTIARAWAAVSLRLDFLPPFTRAGSLKTCPHLGHFMGIG
jgi:hypothetical protein